MLFIQGEIVMRLLSKREVKEMVLYSRQHITRPEKAGLLPKRVMLGPNRVSWVEREVLDWLEVRLALCERPLIREVWRNLVIPQLLMWQA